MGWNVMWEGKTDLLAIDDVWKSVLPYCDIACAEPAVDEGFSCCFWIAVVAVCYDWAFDEDFAWFAFLDIFSVIVYQSVLLFSSDPRTKSRG